jgi:hypothetical protein
MPPRAASGLHRWIRSMVRRLKRSGEVEIDGRFGAAVRGVSRKEAEADAHSEEERQIRAALVEYFSILQDWAQAKEQVRADAEPSP